MSDIRKGVTQAKFNDDASSFVIFEVLFLSIIFGVIFESWWIFGGMFFGLLIGLFIPGLNLIISLFVSFCWGGIASIISAFFFIENNNFPSENYLDNIYILASNGATLIPFIFIFLSSLGAHLATIEWLHDINDSDEKNAKSSIKDE